jgi:6-phosphogluconolactonase
LGQEEGMFCGCAIGIVPLAWSLDHAGPISLDPSGRLLVAASDLPMAVRDGNTVTTLAAGLSVYRIGSDGTLDFVRKYDVDTGKFMQCWSGMVTRA